MLAAVSASGVAIFLSLVAGVAGSIQVAVSGAFGKRIGVLEATAFGSLGAAIIVCSIVLVARQGFGGVAAGFREPPWLWLNGVMGAIVASSGMAELTPVKEAGLRDFLLPFIPVLVAGFLAPEVIARWRGAALLYPSAARLRVERVLCVALLCAGFIALALLDTNVTLYTLFGAVFMLGCGMGLSMLALLLAVQHGVDRTRLGIATSLNQFSRSVGAAVGIAAMSKGASRKECTVTVIPEPRPSLTGLARPARSRSDAKSCRRRTGVGYRGEGA